MDGSVVDPEESRSQSPLIPLTIAEESMNFSADIEEERKERGEGEEGEEGGEGEEDEEEDILNSSLTPMDWLPRLNAKAGLVEEEPSEEERKPPYSYATLIRLAILNSEGEKATLAEIYRWIQDQFTYYRHLSHPGWKNSIRHNLSLNKCFLKMARTRQDPGKGCYWTINPIFEQQQEEHIRQWKRILADQIVGLQGKPVQPTFTQQLNRPKSIHGYSLDDLLNPSHVERSQEKVREKLDFRSLENITPTAGLDWNFFEGLLPADINDMVKLGKNDCQDSRPKIKEELIFTDSNLSDQTVSPPSQSHADIFQCVDPSEVLGQQRLPSIWSPSRPRWEENWRLVPQFQDDDMQIDYDKLL